ncbi:branched-chain amino acid ABC transporter permease [Natronorubrum texcoconense]|uniref:Branched-chain amino acid transport system permease protein n=1 Tax=Natronorubrum texcoconense TaxID=1095776 RepID=A0A1G9D6V3_9EURY|nr:branched-chain amino acid ABC transporter permease [Natronorubrum texcoconense]SDK59642.1 branched-chain amino acid transport system permease protein [Natronorubrum texcoconense]
MTQVDLEPRYVVGIVCFIGLISAPFLLPILTLRQLTAALFLGMFAMSWDYVSGYTGQLSFGHSMFFGIGGYTAAVLNLELGLTPVLAILVGTIAAGIAGLAVGFPALRLEGPYLALITLIAPLVLVQIVNIFPGTLGGDAGLPSPAGLVSVDEPIGILSTIGFETVFVHETIVYYYLALALFLAIYALFYVFTRSYVGSIFTAIHEDEDAVRSVGINAAKFKVFAFTMSGTVGGLAGAAFVHTAGEPNPGEILSIVVSIEVVLVSILGGMGTITGPAAAGIVYYFVRDALQTSSLTIPVLDATVGHISMALFFAIALLVLFFLPKGALPWVTEWSRDILERRSQRSESPS